MCACRQVEAWVEILLPTESMELTRAAIESLLQATVESQTSRSYEVTTVELDQPHYTPAELAPLLGVSPRTVIRWAEAGCFGPQQNLQTVTGRWRIPREQVSSWLATLGQRSAEAHPAAEGA